MIRIIYRWSVDQADIPAFQDAWRKATRRIHATVKGARGSFLLQESGNPGEIMTVARWDSEEAWKAFWQNEDPDEMRNMRRLGERRSVEVYGEYEDFTV